MQLNYLLVASEFGKLFGFLSGAAADYLPASIILLIGLIMGLIGYGGQYLLMADKIKFLSYWQVLLLNIIAGNSTCWISTYCYVLAIRNFRDLHSTIIAITSSYSALCARIYAILVEGIQGRKGARNPGTYLFLACFLPSTSGFAISVMSCGIKFMESCGGFDMSPVAFFIAISTGIYFIIESVTQMSPQLRALILGFVLIMPFVMALVIKGIQQLRIYKCKCQVIFGIYPKVLATVKQVEIEMDKDWEIVENKLRNEVEEKSKELFERSLKEEATNVDFWLFYLVNMFGATLGLVYMVNLERISKSVTKDESTSFLLEISCAFSFFGRIFPVMLNSCTRKKDIISNTALTVVLMVPMPVAFYTLINEPNRRSLLYISTGILGTCSGALTAITATTIYQLFGSKSFVAKQTLILTNIPLGFLIFGWLAAFNYEKQCEQVLFGSCNFGKQCYNGTFVMWGSFSFVGTILSLILYLRTQAFHNHKSS
ncbi:Major facilitator superfamily protein [Euphorbia peplus]|nr:Major facilitator superfamily protein [Euphorbia peplus]